MDTYTSIQNNLIKRMNLLQEAVALEEKARILREQATTNDLGLEISTIQGEIFIILDRIDLLNRLISLACKLYGNGDEIEISLQDYQNCMFEGKSLAELENELVGLTERIVLLCSLLDTICGYVGHDYKFIKVDSIFDFGGLEIDFEEKEIYYCAICGSPTYLDVGENKTVDSSLVEQLKKLRRARKIQVYESKFKIVDDLHR